MLSADEKSRIYLGTQGWRYPDWRKAPREEDYISAPRFHPVGQDEYEDDLQSPFYLKNIAPRDELKHYSHTFNAVEVDSTFYAIPQSDWVKGWRDAVGPDFRFALKLPRILTHDYGLTRGRRSLTHFCEVASVLEEKLTAILIQLPPTFAPDQYDIFKKFCAHLPTELPFAVEFRDAGWLTNRTRDLLAEYNVAWMLGPTPWLGAQACRPFLENLPTDWLYIRFMGERDEMPFSYLQIDRDEDMDFWAAEIKRLAADGKRVIALLDNHYQGYSPGSARLLANRLGLELGPYPRDQQIGDQMNLF